MSAGLKAVLLVVKPAERVGSMREREPMAYYKITALYEYEAVVSGNTQEEAEKNFLADLNSHYSGTESIDFTIVCGGCEQELELDGTCGDCDSEDEEEN